jgi:threonine aldolase
MEALAKANEGWSNPYGNDEWTARAVAKLRDVFEAPEAAVYFVATGTAANALVLATMAEPFQTIFCTTVAHIEEDECSAPEFFTGGCKLTLVDADHAKMSPTALAAALERRAGRSVHSAQAGAVSLTQATERGTLYSLAEIEALTTIAKAHSVPVHLDGARFANAIAALGCSAADMTHKIGIDAVSFGGTKNGLMGVEAVVIFDPALAWEFELRRKRAGHLFSKNRFLAVQMDAYLTQDLWLDMARSANTAAGKMAKALGAIDSVTLHHSVDVNMIFASFPAAAHRRLRDAGAAFYPDAGAFDGPDDACFSARIVADWSCPDENIDAFAALVRG